MSSGKWSESIQSVGNALIDLVRAEVEELGRDLRTSRANVVRLLILAGGAIFLSFWLLAILLYSAIEVASLWLPRWGAALAVAGIVAIVVAVIGLLIRGTLKSLDSPVRTVQRRVESHIGWWNETLGSAPGSRLEDGHLAADDEPSDE